MFFGLNLISQAPARELRTEYTTYTDPFVEEGFRATMAPGSLERFTGWSRSYYTLQGHVESIMKFNKPLLPEPTEPKWSQIKEDSFAYFDLLPRVRSMSAKTDFDRVRFHQSTSAGYGYTLNPGPYPSHKGPPDGPNHKRAKRIASKIVFECLQHRNDNTFDKFLRDLPGSTTPDIAFTRTQLAELPDTKIRNVFGECFHYVLLEGLFAMPLLDMFMENDTFYFIGADPLLGVPNLINRIPPRDQLFLTIDWSGFDASVQPYEIDLAFDLLESILLFPDVETKLVFKYVRTIFMERKVLSPDGRLFLRKGGIPSGSYFTHMIDSIINWIRIRFLFSKHEIKYRTLKTHGDDCFAELEEFEDDQINPMIDDGYNYGWIINRNKSQLNKDRSRVTFLGRSCVRGSSERDALKCLRLMLYPEYPVTDPQISIARVKSIDYDSGYKIPEIIQVLRYLTTKYGDANIELPREFRRYYDVYVANVSI